MKYVVSFRGQPSLVRIAEDRVVIDDTEYRAQLLRFENSPCYVLELEGQKIPLTLSSVGKGKWIVSIRGDRFEVDVVDERLERARRTAGGARVHRAPLVLTAPMPGLVVRIPVVAGQEVERGTSLVVLEAMKMENELKAAAPSVIERIEVRPGQPVEKGDILVTFRQPASQT
jgi:pyruvate carboxylase subunit B